MTAPPPTGADRIRRALLALIALGPALWLLGRPLLTLGALPGATSAGIYPLLQRFWAVGAVVPERFPSPGTLPEPETIAWLLRPIVILAGPDGVVRLLMLGGLVATALVALRHVQRVLPAPEDQWAAAAAIGVFLASPAVIAGVTSGDLDAWQLWAVLALPLSRGWGSIALGATIAVVAPTQLPTALLPILIGLPNTDRRGPILGWLVGMAVATTIGWPTIESSASYDAWFSALTPAPAPERVFQVYVGVTAVALLVIGLAGNLNKWAWIGALALLGGLLRSPIPPERFLQLVPYAAAISGLAALRRAWPEWSPAVAVLLGAALLGEGWKGVAAPVPLATATLAPIAPLAEIAAGPLLDLPATRGAIRRGLWFQTLHGNPIAAGADGLVDDAVLKASTALTPTSCQNLAALGFSTIVARREGAFRELDTLRQCLGAPSWDDGAVAVWRLNDPPATPAPQ